MSSTKDKHYWTQLRTVLTGGQWDASFPAKAPNGAPLSWSELLRKFNKHCTGFSDVAELASQTQALSLLLAANATDQSLDGNEVSQEGPLSLGEECILPEERMSEGTAGYNALRSIGGSNTESIKLAVAYYAYALGHPSECLSLLAQVRDLMDVQGHIPVSGTMRSNSLTLQVLNSGANSSSSSWIGSFATTSSVATVADITDGRAWAMTESFRSTCLQGMSHERISPTDSTALDAYLSAVPLLKTVASEIPCTLPTKTASGAGEPGSFVRYRELWRWIERLLRRAIILASRMWDLSCEGDKQDSLWSLFDHYQVCSAHWPPTFRPEYRSTILALNLRAFILRAHAWASSSLKTTAPRWMSSARSIIQEYRSILSVNTHFPRAGERNAKVEDFVDLCVAVWEGDGAVGEYAGWVIDILWWATRLTFNSYRVFRHMARLLSVSGDPELAKRTLRLYVQVVAKAREAGIPEADNLHHNGHSAAVDADTDRNWVSTLVHGARMLCRLALQETDYGKALDQAKEAGVMIEKAKTRLDPDDKELVAGVQLAEGIWSSVMAHTEQDPLTRSTRLSHALAVLFAAMGTYPTPSIHHHLALALSRPGPSQNMQEAIQHARTAVESDPSEVRHWHLLGLLLAATGDWRAAKGVLEFGVETGETDLTDENLDPPERANGNVNGLRIRDFADSQPPTGSSGNDDAHLNGNGNPMNGHIGSRPLGTLLNPDAIQTPPSSTLLQSFGDRPPPSHQERFEFALQTRMTQLALTEFVEGAEGVSEKWLEVFQWFREKRGVNVDDRRMSIDSRRVSMDARPLSEIASVQEPPPSNITSNAALGTASNVEPFQDEMPTPIPITITPASPGILTPQYPPEPSATERLGNGNENGIEKRSSSLDEKDRDISRGKKVKESLKTRVHKGQARISTISKKIGHGVGRRSSLTLKRTTSAPDFHSVLSQAPYQASSIHLRQHQGIHASQQELRLLEVPPPPPSPSPAPTNGQKQNTRSSKDRRLLSDLWLMSAAIFRRLGKIEQAKGAIQEAEVRDEDNPAVWVQLGLYYTALSNQRRAIEAFQKALFISPNDISATIHLCHLYLSPLADPTNPTKDLVPERDNVDLAAGLLSDLTQGAGWDVPEAWYFLAKAYKLQGRRDRERECLSFALTLSETRGVRDIGVAIGWCL